MGSPISGFITKNLVDELKVLEGKHLNKIQQIGPELFKFRFTKHDLLIEIGKRFNLTNYRQTAPQKPSNFSIILKKKIGNKRLVSVEQHDFDRVVILDFKDYKLIAEFFSHGNLVLVDTKYKILLTFRAEQWKDRTFKVGAIYKFPQNVKITKLRESYEPVSKDFISKYNSFSEAIDEFYIREEQKVESKALKKLRKRLEKQHETLKEYDKKIGLEREKAKLIEKNYELIQSIIDDSKNKTKLEKLGAERKGSKIIIDLH